MGKRSRSQKKGEDVSGKRSPARLSPRVVLACGATIYLITFMLYTPALNNNFVNWDDPSYVYENSYISSLTLHSLYWMLTSFHAGNWHPLTWISHAIDYASFGLNPLGHHLTSIVLHGMNTMLVFLLALQLLLKAQAVNKAPLTTTGTLSISARALIAGGVTALLFGVHPVHVESVAWVAERKDVLCAFFFLSALCSYLFYACAADTKNRRTWYTACLVLSIGALMAKPMAVTFPLVLMLLDIYPLKRITLSTGTDAPVSVFLEKIPFFALTACFGVLTMLAQHAGGAVVGLESLPLPFRLANALHAPLFYLTKMVWPVDLVPVYPFPVHMDFLNLQYIVSGVIVVCAGGVSIWMLKREAYLFFTACSYYLITLLPVLGIIQVGIQAASDRYTYLPSISIFLLAGIGASRLFEKSSALINKVVWGALLAVLILLGQVTIQQIKIWQDSEMLWSSVIRRFPGRVPVAHNNLGLAYDRRGLYDKAAIEYEKAIAILPAFEDPHYNLGLSYYRRGMYDRAAAEYEKAIAINPKLADAYYNLGLTYDRVGMYDRAAAEYEKAIGINPQFAKAYNDLGFVYYTKGMYDKATAACEKALSINPGLAQAHNYLGLIYHTKGMYDAAIAAYEKALSINPALAESHHNLGLSYFAQGKYDRAIAAYERALSINPALAETHNYLGLVYYTQGNYSMANIHFDKASALGYKIDPHLLESIAGRVQ